MARNIVALLVITIVAVSIGIAAAASYMDLGKQLDVSEEVQKKELVSKLAPVLMDELKSRIKVGLRIYKNGELVYYNPDDPISVEWLKAVANVVFRSPDFGKTYNYRTIDGSEHNWLNIDDATNTRPCIALGNGTTPASPYDYRLENELLKKCLGANNVLVNDTGTRYEIYLRYTFTVTENYTISEAGYELYTYVGNAGSRDNFNYGYLLVARDTFDPIQVNAGESISVEYVIVLDYSKPPFTKFFWQYIADNALGLYYIKALTRDESNYKYTITYVVPWDSIKFAYVLEDLPWSPDVEPAQTSPMWIPRIWDVYVTESGIDVYSFMIQEDIENTYDVYGIAIYLKVWRSDYNYVYKLIAFIRLDQAPITVDWTEGFKVDLGLSITES